MKEVLFTVNGPGEIHGFTIPLAKALRRLQGQDIKLSIFILPCQFSSGFEEEVAVKSGLFDNVLLPGDYKKFLIKKKLRKDYQPETEGVVFYTGGDTWHALKLSRYLCWPLFGYDEGHMSRKKKFDKIFTIGIDGNLMIDSATDRQYYYSAKPIGSDEVALALFPGSRRSFVEFMVPFYEEVVQKLQSKHKHLNIFFVINRNQQQLWQDQFQDINIPVKYTDERFSVDLAVSLIGTNTAILAAKGIPMIALLPLNKAEGIPMTGILGFIDITFIGRLLKRTILRLIAMKKRLYAIPNIKAGSMLVPEMVGKLLPKDVAQEAEKLLFDINRRNRMSVNIKDVIGKPGAADKISKEIVGSI